MSAFVVSPQHINALITFALHGPRATQHESPASYYWNGNRHSITEATADLLWQENIRSVGIRYPDCKSVADMPGDIGMPEHLTFREVKTATVSNNGKGTRTVALQPADIVGMCNCLDYQSCESGDWEQTEAYAALQAIRNKAVVLLVARANPVVSWSL